MKLFSYKNYTLLYFAGLISEIGSFITESVMMMFVFSQTHDQSYLGMTRGIFLFFFVVGILLGGPMGRTYNKKKILVLCDLARIPIILVILWIDDIHLIMLFNGFIAFFTGIFYPIRQALVNELVPPTLIRYANSLFGSTFAILNMLAPFLGGMVFAQTGRIEEILVFDLLTYTFGILLLSRMHFIFISTDADNTGLPFLSNLKSCLQRQKALVPLYFNSFMMGSVIGVLIPLILPFVTDIMGGGYREYSIVMTLFGLGGVIGGALAGKIISFVREGRLIIILTLFELVMMNLWIRTHDFKANLAVIFLWGILVFIRITTQINYVSKSVESKHLSESFSFLDLSYFVPNIAGGFLIGLLGNHFATLDILKILGFAFASIMGLRFIFGELRTLYFSDLKQAHREETNFR